MLGLQLTFGALLGERFSLVDTPNSGKKTVSDIGEVSAEFQKRIQHSGSPGYLQGTQLENGKGHSAYSSLCAVGQLFSVIGPDVEGLGNAGTSAKIEVIGDIWIALLNEFIDARNDLAEFTK